MKKLHGNITKLYIFSFLQMMLFPMAIITLFWKEHAGLNLTQILLLQSIFSVITVLLDYPAGYVSDRLGYRVALSIASLIGMVGWGMYTVANSFWSVLLAESLLGISLSFVSGSDSALLYETLKGEGKEQLYARYEGRMNGFAQTGEAMGAVFAGVLYAAAPLSPFILEVAVWGAALLVTRSLVETPRESTHQIRSHLMEAVHTARYAFWENKHLRYTMLFSTLLGISSFFPVWLIQPYMRQTGVPIAWFGPVWAGANLTVALSALVSHRVHSYLGDRKMTWLFCLLIVAGYFGLGLIGGLWGFLFYYLLTCMRGLRGPVIRNHVQIESPSANRAAVLSLQSVSFRICFACVGPFVGRLADAAGVQRTFYFIMYGFLISLPPLAIMFLKSFRERNGAVSEN